MMNLTPEQFARLNRWFDEAVDLPFPERAALIEGVRGHEGGEMADRLAGLLEANDRTTGTIDESLVKTPQLATLEKKGAFGEGELILGRFRIVRCWAAAGWARYTRPSIGNSGRWR